MIEEQLYDYLKVLGVTAYPVVAPATATVPFIVYARVSTIRYDDFDGPSGLASATFRIDVYDKTYLANRTLANAVRVALDGKQTPEMSITLEMERDLTDEQSQPILYRTNLEFRITHSE